MKTSDELSQVLKDSILQIFQRWDNVAAITTAAHMRRSIQGFELRSDELDVSSLQGILFLAMRAEIYKRALIGAAKAQAHDIGFEVMRHVAFGSYRHAGLTVHCKNFVEQSNTSSYGWQGPGFGVTEQLSDQNFACSCNQRLKSKDINGFSAVYRIR
jgi:hypothetical protein